MNKKSLKVFSIGAILGSMMQAGIPISAEATVDSYIIKVSQEVYSYNKDQLNEEFLNFKMGETSKLYNDFVIKLKMANGFYAFHDKKTGYIKYEDIENKYLESKLEEKKFNVDEFTESKECKVIEVNWIKKAIVTIEGTVKYITPDDDSKNVYEDTSEASKQSGSSGKHNSKDSTSKIEIEKQKQEKLAQLLKNDKKIELNEPEKLDIVVKEAVKQLKSKFTVVVPYKEYKKYNFKNFNNIMIQLGGEDYGKPGICSYVELISIKDGKIPIFVNLDYRRDIDEVKSQKQATEVAVKRIVKEVIKDDMTPVEKELTLHDYVVKHAEYNMEGINNKSVNLEDHSAYGVLVLGKGVCESYAKAMHLLLNEAGVECKYVTGYKKDIDGTQGGVHAWNIVKLDNEWYNLDVTWDDPVSDIVGRSDKDVVVSPVIHKYFNVPDDIFNKDHIRGKYEKKNYPKCTATKYYYKNIHIPQYISDGQ